VGEYADLLLNGDVCQYCMCEFGEGDGYPRSCRGCRQHEPKEVKPKKPQPIAKVSCPTCKKRVKHNGLADHMRDAHQAKS